MTEPAFARPAALALALLLAVPVAAAETPCADPLLTVEAGDKALASRVCAVADGFLASVGKCGLGLRAPVRIEVTDQVDANDPDCVAKFRCVAGQLLVVPPGRLAEIGTLDDPFAAIPTEAFFDSILAHELTHGLVFQAAPDVTRIRQEYLAHALQIGALPEPVRAAFLADTAFEGPPEALISLPVLQYFPAYFASAAWTYFDSEGGLCGAVGQVIAGRTPF